jgi:phosphatidylglycerophosphatase A
MVIATGVGAGFAPLAPGTVGALEGVGVFLLIATLSPQWRIPIFMAANLLVFVVGVWASGRVCDLLSSKDPSRIVIDEISGQMIALVPAALNPSTAAVVAAFLLFRAFDILKPYPIRKLEALSKGFGVMCDDALAGVYAGVLVLAWQMVQP